MKLYFMKEKALIYLKSNMKMFYFKYYHEKTNDWIKELFDYDPFEFFMEIPDFSLMAIGDSAGKTDLENCKLFYTNLMRISESQASEERLWAGLCNSTFYDFVRKRWNYDELKMKNPEADSGAILSRFFLKTGTRGGFFRNTLAKYWWVGRSTYDAVDENHFKLLDYLGPDDLSTKISDLFYSNTFASNLSIMRAVCVAWKCFNDEHKERKLTVREYFRPAVQYLNAFGGGVMLDALGDDELTQIVYQYFEQLLDNNYQKAIELNEDGFEDEEAVDDVINVNEDVKKVVEDSEQSILPSEAELRAKVAVDKVLHPKSPEEILRGMVGLTVIHKKWGEVRILSIDGDLMITETLKGVKAGSHAILSIKYCIQNDLLTW